MAGASYHLGMEKQDVFAWSGACWKQLGSGLWNGQPGYIQLPEVTAICEWRDALYFGGNFTVAGNRPSFHMACWDGRSTALSVPGPVLAQGNVQNIHL